MNEDELVAAVNAATDVLRVETLDAYDADSDADFVDRYLGGAPKPDPSEKATWLGLIRAAAERGHPWRRLRLVQRPVSDYVRYACEWGYVDNVAAGEDVRVIDSHWFPTKARGIRRYGDSYVLDGRVLRMAYDRDGRFISATTQPRMSGEHWAWPFATPFTEWWAANPDLHRDAYATS